MNNTFAANVSQTNDQSSSKDATSKTEGIVFFSAFILTSVLTVAGNTLTIVLFAMKRNIRKKHFFLAVNLASADLLLGAVSLPIYSCYVGFNFGPWTLTESFSTLSGSIFSSRLLILSSRKPHLFLQPSYPVRDSIPYIGRLSIKHCQREHTAMLFLYCGSLLSLFLRYWLDQTSFFQTNTPG